MAKVSLILPARNEQYLEHTVKDALANAHGDIEIIAILDGPTQYSLQVPDNRLRLVFHSTPRGKRVCENHAASIAKGDYLLFADAHCMFSPGYDEALQHECDLDWVVIPRRYSLDPEKWEIIPNSGIDYFYLSCPWTDKRRIIQACPWFSRTKERKDGPMIDDTMSFQGSMAFMSAAHFRERIGGLEIARWGASASADWLEIGMKTWMAGGRVVVNKNVYYAHWHKAHQPRGYQWNINAVLPQLKSASLYWFTDQWQGAIAGRDFGWLVDHFWPLPMEGHHASKDRHTWPENWREMYEASKA